MLPIAAIIGWVLFGLGLPAAFVPVGIDQCKKGNLKGIKGCVGNKGAAMLGMESPLQASNSEYLAGAYDPDMSDATLSDLASTIWPHNTVPDFYDKVDAWKNLNALSAPATLGGHVQPAVAVNISAANKLPVPDLVVVTNETNKEAPLSIYSFNDDIANDEKTLMKIYGEIIGNADISGLKIGQSDEDLSWLELDGGKATFEALGLNNATVLAERLGASVVSVNELTNL